MALEVDETAQNTELLLQGIANHKAELESRGFGEQRELKLRAMLNDVLKKDSAQKAATAILLQRTQQQETAMSNSWAAISRIQNSGKAAFGRRSTILKEFRVGLNRPKSVKEMRMALEYMTALVVKYNADLIANGMLQEEIEGLSDVYAELIAADTVQESAKKVKSGATALRDEAVKKLNSEIFKVRKLATAAFAGNKAVLQEFKPIAKTGRRGGRPAAGTPPAS